MQQNTQHEIILTTRKEDLEPLTPPWLNNGKITTLNLLDKNETKNVCEGIDCIIHTATVNENISHDDPVLALQVNTEGTLHLLRGAIENVPVDAVITFVVAGGGQIEIDGNGHQIRHRGSLRPVRSSPMQAALPLDVVHHRRQHCRLPELRSEIVDRLLS